MLNLYTGLTALLEPLAGVALKLKAKDEGLELHRERLGYCKSTPGTLWCHAASLGEVAALEPVMKHLLREIPALSISGTASTLTGRNRMAEIPGVEVSLAPLDLPRAVKRTYETKRPQGLLLIETELWPNLLLEAQRRSIPVGVVNGRISDRAWPRYRRTRWFWKPLLERLQALAVRTETDRRRYAELGAREQAIAVTGNTKHDGYDNVGKLSLPWSRDRVITLGSVHPQESKVLIPALRRLVDHQAQPRFIVAPRHLDTTEFWLQELADAGLSVTRWSDGAQEDSQGFVLDAYGLLPQAYGASGAAFVGGSLSSLGGHNPMEAAAQGVPIVMGPHCHTVQLEVEVLQRAGGLVIHGSSNEIARSLERWLELPEQGHDAGQKARHVVDQNRGAVARSVAWLQQHGVVGKS